MTAFFKKPLVRWGLFLLVIFSVYHGVMSNLKSHSLYYLSQSHYDKTKLPEYVLLAENYEYLEFDGLDGKISRTYERIFDSVDDYIIYKKGDKELFRVGLLHDSFINGRIVDFSSGAPHSRHIISSDGQVSVYDNWLHGFNDVFPSDVSGLRQAIAPIMATQKAPTINLQWVFNVFYYLRFD